MSLVYSNYNMLPKFNKVTSPFFMPESRYEEKRLEQAKFTTLLNMDLSNEEKQIISKFIFSNRNNTDAPFNRWHSLNYIIDNIREDIVVHRRKNNKDYTCYIHACFPNGWVPEKVIGKSFYDIHKPVPGFNLATASKMVDACINKGPFERYVWGLDFDHQHRISFNYPQLKFNINNPVLYVKVETQIIVGLPQVEAFMFILRQDFIPEFAIHKPTLLNSLKSMSPEQKIYKNVSDDLIKYLGG